MPASKRDYLGDDHLAVFLLDLLPTLNLQPILDAYPEMELLVAERDWEPPRPRFAPDQIVGLRVAFAEVAVRDRVKQAGGT